MIIESVLHRDAHADLPPSLMHELTLLHSRSDARAIARLDFWVCGAEGRTF